MRRRTHVARAAGPIVAVALAMLGAPGCSQDDPPASTTTTRAAATVTSTSSGPTSTSSPPTSAAPPTTADPQLACLGDALGAHPELLEAFDDEDASAADRLRAVLVARTCLPLEQVRDALAASLRDGITEELSDYQAECLADLVLDLPDRDLGTLLGVESAAPATTEARYATREQIAARLLDLCGVAPG